MHEHEHPWDRSSAGLRMVAHAMILQLVLVAVTLLTVLLVVTSEKADAMQGMAMLLALVGLVAQIIMVTGVFRFAGQPPPRPSAGLAQAAGAFGMIGVAVSVYVLIVLLQVSSIGPTSDAEAVHSAMEAAKALPTIELLAAAVGFLAMVLFLAAAGAAARYFREIELERKARTAVAMVILSGVIYAFIKLGVTPREPTGIIAALVMTTIVQIAAFVMSLGTVRGLIVVLRGPIPGAELPRARSL